MADETPYSSDSPLTDRTSDELGRGNFVSALVDLLATPRDDSLVVGLYGGWGEGKTTVLNFAADELDKRDELVVIKFNPWLFPTEAQLLSNFLNQMAAALGSKLTHRYEELSNSLSQYASAVSLAGLPGTATENLLKKIGQVTPNTLKKRLEDILSASDKYLVVILDDIDRLDKNEVQSIFRLVKLVANFPRTSYVLAFDERAVSAALADRFPGSYSKQRSLPSDYLEKIVQVPLYLPRASVATLLRTTGNAIQSVFDRRGIEPSAHDLDRFATNFANGVGPGLTTMRDVRRFSNVLSFSLKALGARVNPVDLVMLEAVRVVYPSVLTSIRENQEVYLNELPSTPAELREEQYRAMGSCLEDALRELEPKQQSGANQLVRALFPQILQLDRNIGFSKGDHERWESDKRICSERHFARYFTYDLDSDDVDEDDLDRVIAGLSDAGGREGAEQKISEIALSSRQLSLIEYLRQRVRTLDSVVAERLVVLLSAVAESIPDNQRGIFTVATNPFDQSAILISELIVKVSLVDDARDNALALADALMREHAPIEHAIEINRWLTSVNVDGKKLNFEPAELQSLNDRITYRVTQCATANEPQEWILDCATSRPKMLVQWWFNEGDRDVLRRHFEAALRHSPGRSLKLLDVLVNESYELGGEQRTFKDLSREEYVFIKQVVDPTVMVDCLRLATGLALAGGDSWVYEDPRGVEVALARQFAWRVSNEPSSGTG